MWETIQRFKGFEYFCKALLPKVTSGFELLSAPGTTQQNIHDPCCFWVDDYEYEWTINI